MQLIKNVSASVLDNFIGEVVLIGAVGSEYGSGDYFSVNGIVAFIQNFTEVGTTETLTTPTYFGFYNDKEVTTLEIDY